MAEKKVGNAMSIKYSVWSNYFHDLTPEERVLRFCECGFNCSEFSDEDGDILLNRGKNAVSDFRSFADSNGFSFPQGHLFLKADICEEKSVDVLKRWLDMFSELGITAAVLHAGGGYNLECDSERFERRVNTIAALCSYIKGRDLTICLENLCGHKSLPRTSDDLFRYIKAVNQENLAICLDTGHLNFVRQGEGVAETQREFILNSGRYLKALHIADNDGSYDQHLTPYGRGNINWSEVLDSLKEVGYNGLFNLEIPGESNAPLEIRLEKLKYIKSLCRFMCRGL